MTEILIVEDEKIVAADLTKRLRQLGYAVAGTAISGEQALELAVQRKPDLVLMDIRLGGAMDGIQAANWIRQHCDLPVIYLTAHSDQNTLTRAKVTEPFGYVLKPFEERELATHIEMALYKHAAERRLRQANADLEQRVGERTAELRTVAAQLVQAEERERQRIGKLLHDDAQQLLAAVALRLDGNCAEAGNSAQGQALKETRQLVLEAVRIVRDLSHELCPPTLGEGLAVSLEWLGQWMHQRHALAVHVQAKDDAVRLPKDVTLVLFQSVRELLFNVVKHARVSEARVTVACDARRGIQVTVSDEGAGFDPDVLRERRRETGLGLVNIGERMKWLGGRMDIDSSPGQGTRIRLAAPLGVAA